jgi:putative transcriptional regulator
MTKIKNGDFLVAEPYMEDSFFKDSVVFVAESTKVGVLGFMVNKPLDIVVSDLHDELEDVNLPVHFGGPIAKESSMYILHKLGEDLEGSVHLIDDIWWGGDLKGIKNLYNLGLLNPNHIRFFLGYTSWETLQLRDEINEKSWYICKNNSSFVFNNNPKQLWSQLLSETDNHLKLIASIKHDFHLN